MATSSLVPQAVSPVPILNQNPGNPTISTGPNSVAAAPANPYIPAGTVQAPTPYSTDAPGTSPNTYATNVQPIVPGGVASNNLQTQLVDIYGQGVGASLFNLLNNASGTDSTVLQEYEQSLQPQEATASANIGASLGASGVSANSSVNAIAQANLGAQETASVAGEAANLTEQQESLEADILMGTAGAATKEVASSPWTTLGTVMNNIAGDVGDIVSGGSFSYNGPSATSASGYASPFGDGAGSVPTATLDDSPVNTEDLSAAYF